ncbi:MAG TPA: pirin family protein [Pseudonocardia sp.]|nr:pirin family protein [Pseudonocardia sp.]
MTVTRTLPNRDRRMVGAWCFIDHYGPQDITGTPGMQVPPHPHTGLQTVSWLVEGQVLHHDSVGSEQLVTPGQLNLMTAGHGIAHSEQSPVERTPILHGVQLWTALPDADRAVAPHFEHHPDLPELAAGGCTVTVIMGELGGCTSPAEVYSPLVGAEAVLAPGADTGLPLRPDWEYAVLTLAGEAEVDGLALAPGPLLYLGLGRAELALRAASPARLLLVGGEPFAEHLVMWWNFVGRDHDDIVTAREQWMAGDARFGPVRGYSGSPLAAPPMPSTRLRPRGRQR